MVLNNVLTDIKNGQFLPVYFLHGEEPFYMDKISSLIEETILDESQKDFNQTILYGPDTSIEEIVNIAKRYPMMAPYQVVIVKEAQHLSRNIEKLLSYVEHLVPTTVLVLCYKNKTLDKRKALGKYLAKQKWLFDCLSLKDYQLNDWVVNYAKAKGLGVEPKAAILLAEFIGNDLSGISSAVSKLEVLVGEKKIITADLVHKNIGFSKDYNIFELQNALSEKNVFKANKIIYHFSKNKKKYPFAVTISSLYTFFTKLMKFHFYEGKLSDQELAKKVGVHSFFLKQYKVAARNYTKNKLARIFSYLRDYDMKSKGLNNVSASDEELLKEMIFKILH
ncbi:MAG: DNA polymerase III subunit delta [Crocinitomicaceae bacterium]|nr:DNA polymerase III subunit delta [Crocinitomicaceae bacterium]